MDNIVNISAHIEANSSSDKKIDIALTILIDHGIGYFVKTKATLFGEEQSQILYTADGIYLTKEQYITVLRKYKKHITAKLIHQEDASIQELDKQIEKLTAGLKQAA